MPPCKKKNYEKIKMYPGTTIANQIETKKKEKINIVQ